MILGVSPSKSGFWRPPDYWLEAGRDRMFGGRVQNAGEQGICAPARVHLVDFYEFLPIMLPIGCSRLILCAPEQEHIH